MKLPIRVSAALASLFLFSSAKGAPTEFVVWSDEPNFVKPSIVLPAGFEWEECQGKQWFDGSDEALIGWVVEFLQEGVERMTGQQLPVVDSGNGIVLTLFENADETIRGDTAIQEALMNDGSDAYNDREAFFIRSEADRLLVVANTPQGLACAIPALLESVGYEVLGMGPNWIHTPDDRRKRLAFRIELADRPGYYIRGLGATSGQPYGVGTIRDAELLGDDADELVMDSYRRWQLGRRMKTRSMPLFPGHALQAYHKAVVEHIRQSGDTRGFLGEVGLGPDADRPAAAEDDKRRLWINSDDEKVFYVREGEWTEANLASLPANLDLSVPAVRKIVFDQLVAKSEKFWEKSPDKVFIFGTDPEDGGGYAVLADLLDNPNWYPEYLESTGRDFGAPYVLHGFKDLDQPREIWDPKAASDTVFGFNNWLLWEYDRHVDSLPEAERVTASGQPKKEAVRCSFYSYNYHDVPPNFNVDPRIRLMIASYPKNRGRGKWKHFASQTDMAQALKVMLPREPSGDYWIVSLSYFQDVGIDGLDPGWEGTSPADLVKRQREHYAAGFRALNVETDFNFGRKGLSYYLLSELIWNPALTEAELNAIRDRWLQRAYGSGWEAMKRYHDYRLNDNYPVNSPHAWSRAIRMIEEASELVDPDKEPDARRRIDDMKQFWYYYYLVDTGENKPTSPAMRELFWKGQMSYMNASHMIARRVFGTSDTKYAAADYVGTPARFTTEETAGWWPKILDHWPVVPVTKFDASNIDLNDLVAVEEFGDAPPLQGFIYNAGYMVPPTFLQTARETGEELGFQLTWPTRPSHPNDRYYLARDVPWGVSVWDPQAKSWESVVDITMTFQPSQEVQIPEKKVPSNHAAVRFSAPRAGTYRFEIGRGGNLASLTDLGWNVSEDAFTGGGSMTFDGNAIGLTQRPTYIYIPKGTKTLDLEVWDSSKRKIVTLYKSITPDRKTESRKVDVSERKTHRIELQPDETGTIAEIASNGFNFPYLYSVPQLWAKSPGQLLVPRAIAEADGLTIR